MIFLITKHKNSESTGLVISHWMSTRYTIEFMGLWEKMHNPDFNVTEFSNIRNESGSHGFVLSSKKEDIWAKEAEDRIEAYDRGLISTVSEDDVFSKYRR